MIRSCHRRFPVKKDAVKIWPATLLKKKFRNRYFPVNFAKFLEQLFQRTYPVAASVVFWNKFKEGVSNHRQNTISTAPFRFRWLLVSGNPLLPTFLIFITFCPGTRVRINFLVGFNRKYWTKSLYGCNLHTNW